MRARRIGIAAAAALAMLGLATTAFSQPSPDASSSPGEEVERDEHRDVEESVDDPEPPQVVPPVLEQAAAPAYPERALEDRVHAVVVLQLHITTEGRVAAAEVESLTVIPEGGAPRAGDGRYGFGPAAVAAAKQLVFSPATYGGEPFEVQVSFTYRFELPLAEAEEPAPAEAAAAPVVNFAGELIERGTRSPVPGATVTVYRGQGASLEGFEATSGPGGSFEFYDLPAGPWSVRIERDGYIPIETNETFSATERVEGRYWIEKGSYSPYDVTIEAERPRKEVSRRTLTQAQIQRTPGQISDDPVLIVENLPGVARTLGGEIVVRGSGPEDTGVFVNGVGVPLIYHFGGLKSVVPTQAVGGIDFYPGNYSVAYGRALGGVLDLQLRRLEPDRLRGSADVSVLDTSLFVEAPLGQNAAIAFGGRRSYLDVVLEATIPDDAGFALTTAPRYYDYQVLGNWRPRPAHDTRWLFLGSDDRLELLFDDPADPYGLAESGEIGLSTSFQRVIADYRYTPSERFRNLLRISAGRDLLDFSILGAFFVEANIKSLELREAATFRLSDTVSLEAGLDSVLAHVRGNVRLPVNQGGEGQPNDFDPSDIRTLLGSDVSLVAAPYVEAQLELGRFTLVPGLRLDYFGSRSRISLDPRISGRYRLFDDTTLKAGAAVVHQAPGFFQSNDVFGNPDLGVQRALQYSLGAEHQLTDVINIDVTLFYKALHNLVSPSGELVERDGELVPLLYDNGGKGRVYGAELMVEHAFSNNFSGWISYTLSRAERTDSGADASRRFDYDQPHIFALVAAYALPDNWQLGARWRLVSGSPSTPVIGGYFDSAIDEYNPIYGPTNSDRLPSFHQLDLRVDKTWIYNTWRLSAYLSFINATNHKNVEALTYNYDYSEQGSVNGLPILPVFGLKGEW
jgi:TonB family protein